MLNPISLTYKLSNISSLKRRLLLIVIDIFLIFIGVFTSYFLKFGVKAFNLFGEIYPITFVFILIGIPIYVLTGQYKALTRYVGSKTIYQLCIRNCLLVFVIYFASIFFDFDVGGKSNIILMWFMLTIFISANRLVLRDILLKNINKNIRNFQKIIIYGAGHNGAQLAASLRFNNQYKIVAFIDESSQLFGRNIYGIPIYPSTKLFEFSSRIDQILISEEISNSETKEILKTITKKNNVTLLEVFSIDELAFNKTKSNYSKTIDIEDLLGREGVSTKQELLADGVKDKVICITGAGGSIGSEICRILINLKPKKIVLFEINEACLYTIEQELIKKNLFDVSIKTCLGSVTDKRLVYEVFSNENIDVVFHTAAYKHVPIVEINPLQALYNNCFSTKITCDAAKTFNVEKYILISSDKAVRPCNIMGASKRASELIVQAFAAEVNDNLEKTSNTIFSMVRFGNVIGSSGSVIPLFKKQIAEGGPLTITHSEIVRYFMTIKEASYLVIQASLLAKGGDLFLLDMGTPVKIYDLAKNMIQISGLTLKDEKNPDGDIEIINTGLRPGEKLYEELLINAQAQVTEHQSIFTAKEKSIPYEILWPLIKELEFALNSGNKIKVFTLLKKLVPEWKPSFQTDN